MEQQSESPLNQLNVRLDKTLDNSREAASQKRHQHGFRTARENLNDLVDDGSFVEFGQLAVAAQRNRKSLEDLQTETPCDGVITGTATINCDQFSGSASLSAIVINDYSVLAGTQGYFHHMKIDRLLEAAHRQLLPVVMYAEGGGGRPGDTDAMTSMAGLNVPTFWRWSQLTGVVPRIAVTNGYCFAGNAALFGAADVKIATENSWIGMAGPAMIEGGGLGKFDAKEIGPVAEHECNGGVDLVVKDEASATNAAKKLLGFTQGRQTAFEVPDQTALRTILPENRRMAYDVRKVINVLFDTDSAVELRPRFGRAVLTGFARIEGHPIGYIASDCRHLGGAVDTESARKCSEFIELADRWKLPLVSLIDTPGFMVGPNSEREGATRAMPELFNRAARFTGKWTAVFLRRGYGLGAMALAGGSFHAPQIAVSWPQGEFGGMGLEGAVKLGYKKELEAVPEGPEREALYEQLLGKLYAQGKATEAASFLEFDAVIDPADTRKIVLRGCF